MITIAQGHQLARGNQCISAVQARPVGARILEEEPTIGKTNRRVLPGKDQVWIIKCPVSLLATADRATVLVKHAIAGGP